MESLGALLSNNIFLNVSRLLIIFFTGVACWYTYVKCKLGPVQKSDKVDCIKFGCLMCLIYTVVVQLLFNFILPRILG